MLQQQSIDLHIVMFTVWLWQLYQNEMFCEASQLLGWEHTCRFRVVVPGNEVLALSHNQYNALEKIIFPPLLCFEKLY